MTATKPAAPILTETRMLNRSAFISDMCFGIYQLELESLAAVDRNAALEEAAVLFDKKANRSLNNYGNAVRAGTQEGYASEIRDLKATAPASAAQATDEMREHLETIIAAAYQIAGAHDAPAHILDVLANPCDASARQVEDMLPYQPVGQPLATNAAHVPHGLRKALEEIAYYDGGSVHEGRVMRRIAQSALEADALAAAPEVIALPDAPSEADKLDAKRYRFLRDTAWRIKPNLYDGGRAAVMIGNHGEDLDNEIDRRLAPLPIAAEPIQQEQK